jgi:hypothetical protein
MADSLVGTGHVSESVQAWFEAGFLADQILVMKWDSAVTPSNPAVRSRASMSSPM